MNIKCAFVQFHSTNIYQALNMCNTLWVERPAKDNHCPTGIYDLEGERREEREDKLTSIAYLLRATTLHRHC